MRWAIFIHDPDGDMGYGRVLGGFRSAEAADRKAEAITRVALQMGRDVECIIVEQPEAGTSAKQIVRELFS